MNTNPVVFAIALAVAAGGAFVAGRYTAGGHAAPTGQADAGVSGATQERKILYYRNPMGLPDTSPVPKKDPMGMDYLPVYEGEDEAAEAAGTVKLSAQKIQKLGVRTALAEERSLTRTLRAVGTLEVDERGLYTVAPKFEGWIERLHVNTTGQAVRRGEALMEVYAPELVSAQREYLIAHGGGKALAQATEEARSGFKELSEAALTRLRYWDVSEAQIRRLAETGEVRRTLTLVSPASGVVLELPPMAGRRFMAGEPLYKIADLSRLWLIAEVFEQDLAQVRVGQRARFTVEAYPDRAFEGRVAFVYPTLDPQTRTVKVRIELPNPKGLLKPAMFGTVELATGAARPVLAVPESAVIDSGRRRVVLIDRGEGRFEPREVQTGSRGDGWVEVREGVKAGEAVVVAANFLIDAEANLKAALSAFEAPRHQTHAAEAKVEVIDEASKSLTLTHGPIASLGWPAMTMDFGVADPALFKGLKPGADIAIEFEDRGDGEYVVTRVRKNVAKRHDSPPLPPAGEGRGEGAKPAAGHKGH